MKFGSDLLPFTATASDYAGFARQYPDRIEELFRLAIFQNAERAAKEECEACARVIECYIINSSVASSPIAVGALLSCRDLIRERS